MTDNPTSEASPQKPFWATRLRREMQAAIDLIVLASALAVSYLIRFDFQIPEPHLRALAVQLPVVIACQFAAAGLFGVHRLVWRYVGFGDVQRFIRAIALASTPLVLLRLALPQQLQVLKMPLSIILLDAILATVGLMAVRVARRWLFERFERESNGAPGIEKPVLLIGAGRAGAIAVREMTSHSDLGLRPVGFIDDDPLKHGSTIHGLEVLGGTREIPQLASELGVASAVITMSSAEPEVMRKIVETCERAQLSVQAIPGLFELLQGRVSISRLKQVRIEDLLHRQPVRLLEPSMRALIAGRRVMVTGAGGSIGSELCRQLAALEPERLLLVERAEGALFTIHQELETLWGPSLTQPLVGDVGDTTRMTTLLQRHRPAVVLHAAAHKHVEMMEQNPIEAITNNSLATFELGQICAAHGVEVFLLISTDKAVLPTSIMGASKRLAEMLVQGLARRHSNTRFVTVRFGNVLGSAGSVVPIFREQIRRGGPVTVTDPDATRYFMTIPEAAGLVLEAATLGKGGDVFTLDMGEPVRILDLAHDMIRLSGYRDDEIKVEIIGLRRGEKLVEALERPDEKLERTEHPKIFSVCSQAEITIDAGMIVSRLRRLVANADDLELRAELTGLLPGSVLTPDNMPPRRAAGN